MYTRLEKKSEGSKYNNTTNICIVMIQQDVNVVFIVMGKIYYQNGNKNISLSIADTIKTVLISYTKLNIVC